MAIGGGGEIAVSCGLIVAGDHVTFGLPEMPLGIVPDAGALQRLQHLIPRNIANEMFVLGRQMGAAYIHSIAEKAALMAVIDTAWISPTAPGLAPGASRDRLREVVGRRNAKSRKPRLHQGGNPRFP